MEQPGSVHSSIWRKLTNSLLPTVLEVVNESHLHAHHQAMRNVDSSETHFRVSIISDEFEGKTLMQRHRLVYSILSEELSGGVHALTIKAKTPKEVATS
ncbi:9524_t:CDS:2 [Ambispora gerdemannii]|uniref:9524_t:CDS:1 n=1 Tax=Ambispora gerdemannii TaxID=144530 RepID=A0A9N9GUF9_9GLOM|nr:9524_t:CDS:2 [Ambispora gerdemannii]